MLYKFYIFSILLMSFNSIAQNSRVTLGNKGFLRYDVDVSAEIKNEAKVDGSQYIDSTFQKSGVSGYDGITAMMRYNAFKDEIEFLDNNKIYYLIKTDSMEVTIENKLYKYLEYQKEKGKKEKGFLIELLNDSNARFSFYKKSKIIFIPEYIPTSSYQSPKPAHYNKEQDKFYLGVSNTFVTMPNKKKEFIALLPNHKEAIEKYIKENKISFGDENDLIDFIKFLNTLN